MRLSRRSSQTAPQTVQPALYTVKQAARILAVSPWSVYQLIWSRELASVQIGRCRRIPCESLDLYLIRIVEEAA